MNDIIAHTPTLPGQWKRAVMDPQPSEDTHHGVPGEARPENSRQGVSWMILLGLLLVLLAGGAVALVLTEESARYILFGYTFELNHVEMFVAGAVTMAVLVLGLWMLGSGSRRTARQRRRLRSARAETSNRVSRLEDEKRDLERQLEREHTNGDRLVARSSEEPRP
jgi:ABC-type nickel/cobalt efflux system permease component RcnA